MNFVVSQFHFAQRPTAAKEKMIAVISLKTYWTFVVRAIIRFRDFSPTLIFDRFDSIYPFIRRV